ncbi:hypothetical protein HNR51_003948 [Methylorubrum thiocyanatum]|uniref:Uncharacterized protein n=1 Tax=Methylorubrum thiocyanatum TaxID=47958 RepID=A0AA40VDQ1_9HYPH|nr:hypothetical protein [Methylorubrum thiocyanatum]GJE79263.1 hypothetical protein CJNNKLLH_0589 [Methylorubrum thiocyanatum]
MPNSEQIALTSEMVHPAFGLARIASRRFDMANHLPKNWR